LTWLLDVTSKDCDGVLLGLEEVTSYANACKRVEAVLLLLLCFLLGPVDGEASP
jgi:hypothetical protein